MRTAKNRPCTTGSIIQLFSTDELALNEFLARLGKSHTFKVVYEEHVANNGHFLHFLSTKAIPEKEVDLVCRLSGIGGWSYYVLN